MLLRSTDDVIRNSVYINPYVTRAEAEAAYQMRVQRRLAQQGRNTRGENDNRPADNYPLSGQPSADSRDPVAPVDASLGNQAIIHKNDVALNPLADSFNPQPTCTATSNWPLINPQASRPLVAQRVRDIDFLSFVLFNARSLNNKLCDLQYVLRKDKPHVVCITETWLQSDTPDIV